MKPVTNLTLRQRRKIISRIDNEDNLEKLIELPTEYLDKLLFYTIDLDVHSGEHKCIKLPVVSGPFLRKLDLSTLDFKNVSWSILSPKCSCTDILNMEGLVSAFNEILRVCDSLDIKKENDTRETDEEDKNGYGYIVDYSGTNATIDLTASYEAIGKYTVVVSSCNFEGVKLESSPKDLARIEYIAIYDSNLGNTGFNLMDTDIYAQNSDLTGINLKGRKINAFRNCYYAAGYSNHLDFREVGKNFPGCILCNTGIEIEFCEEDFRLPENKGTLNEVRDIRKELGKALKEYWRGCIFAGRTVPTAKEREEIGFMALDSMSMEEFIKVDSVVAAAISDAIRNRK